ncbi:phospholipase A and acyltransferase 3-like [Puntigrus tetrazona]|uniref:phospholipase A and acyltransferase 3-like n=1 Tax=Puntigrus tetrazona TaxID=1606681 RepID=UPI001C8A521D|nr:phospholipase A and acyltransferase 3-like [Puntigrus tetrazona]
MMRRSLVFLALFGLHLALSIEPLPRFQFGDMVYVARYFLRSRPLFTHWALYVEKGQIEGLQKRSEEDIFHINSVFRIRLSACIFAAMGNVNYTTSNYLDDIVPVQTRVQMIEKIQQLHHHCNLWWPRAHNCEHVATSIRYGFEHSEQRGTWVENWIRNYQRRRQRKLCSCSWTMRLFSSSSLCLLYPY